MSSSPPMDSAPHGSPAAPLYGLILAGGASSRMQRDKAALPYQGKSQLDRAFELVERHVSKAFVSVRSTQVTEPTRAQRPLIVDSVEGGGPIVGIRSALAAHRGAAWLVLACDLPFLTDVAIERLITERDPRVLVTAYLSAHDGLPEPLCAIWEPAAGDAIATYTQNGGVCPRKFLRTHPVKLIEPRDRRALDNVNTPEEYALAQGALGQVQVTVQYFALLREQAGRSEETVQTSAATAADLFDELNARYRFTLARDQLKVAVDAEFADWSHRLRAGDVVVFIPPVAGG